MFLLHLLFPKQSVKLPISYCLAVLLLVVFGPVAPQSAAETVNTDKGITILGREADTPPWKQRWDSARLLARQGKFTEAIENYQAVLREKPHIEEVRWELSKVFIEAGNYEAASVLVEGLLETDATRLDYLISAGELALLNGRYDQAALHYGQALERDPGGPHARDALRGLIGSLTAQGKNRLALPLMEQLYQRGDAAPDLLLDLARFSRDAGDTAKASHYYFELVTKFRVAPETTREAAEALERSGQIEAAAAQWLRFLEERPDDNEIRQKLVGFLLERERFAEALPHLQILLDNGIDREQYLLVAGRIYLVNFSRADKALSYYEQYRQEFPGGRDVSEEIGRLQVILANDLLSIIENNGVWMLWRDLARVTPDRIGIYRAMADLLDDLGKEKELIEVLQIIYRHAPDDLQTLMKLSGLYAKNGLYDECSSALAQVQDQAGLPADFFLLRARCEKGRKDDLQLLESYSAYLERKPSDERVREEALRLAGSIGLLGPLNELYADFAARPRVEAAQAYRMSVVYVDELLKNQLYSDADLVIGQMLGRYGNDQERYLRLAEMRVELYRRQGDTFAAERQLRLNAARYPDNPDAVLALADFALSKRDEEAAAVWISAARRRLTSSTGEDSANGAIRSHEIVLYDIRSLNLAGRKEEAITRATDYLTQLEAAGAINAFDSSILFFLVKEHYLAERYGRCHLLLERYQRYFAGSARIAALNYLVEARVGSGAATPPAGGDDRLFTGASLAERFEIVDLLVELNSFREAKRLLDDLRQEIPASVRARALSAQVNLALLAYDDAYRDYRDLSQSFPPERHFRRQVYEIEYLRGNSPQIIEELMDVAAAGAPPGGKAGAGGAAEPASPALRLLLARALWTENRWDEALEIYYDLYIGLTGTVSDEVAVLRDSASIRSVRHISFWGRLVSPASDAELLEIIMKPSFFAEHLDEEVAEKTAALYETYRWQLIIAKEREAKNALNAKEFYQAEKNYQELLIVDESAGEEEYPDLATIYSRLGRRAKETELLEKMREKKIEYPELKEAAEKNVRQRQPQLAFDGSYLEKDGRGGFVDITKKYTGIGLHIEPSVHQELGFRAARNEYGNQQASTLLKSNYIVAHYAITFNDFVDGELSVGVEDLDTDGTTFFLYDAVITGALDESVEAYAMLKQEPVDDTIQSLAEGIYRQYFGAGLSVDYLPRIFLGFDFSLRDYSDDNEGERYHLWASYRMFGDTSLFDVTYNYEKVENRIDNSGLVFDADSADQDGLSYWSPGSYWQHMITAEYRHELWPTGRLQSGTSYVSARYGIGTESEKDLIQQVEVNIFLEITRLFLVKGTLVSEWSEDFNRQQALASFVYRW